MNTLALAVSVALPAVFAAGVIFHKYVISEAQSIKQHVTQEVNELRAQISTGIAKI